jgi:predicted nucleotidyltransferase
MSLAQALSAKSIDPAVAKDWASDIAALIRAASSPQRIILFGSGADGHFREGSDLDLLLVYPDVTALRAARTNVRQSGRLSTRCPVDLVFVTSERFEKYKDLGGVCHIAAHEGIDL